MLWAATALAVLPVPELVARVNDGAGLLAVDEAQRLEQRLAAFERETSHQIVVLTVPSLDGEAIESFAFRVAEAWKIGHEGLDNGALIVVASRDRRARIEVGYGLEGVVPDALAARILRDHMIPRFKEGAMGRGIEAGADALMSAARGEAIAAERRPGNERGPGGDDPMAAVLMGGLFGGALGHGLARRRRLLGIVAGAAIAGTIGFVLLAQLPLAAFSAAIGGIFAGLGFGRGLGSVPIGRGGGFGGGGFGGGGFGGGGGGFGGGGASGGW